MSLGFKKGSLVKHKKHGLCYMSGNMNGRLSLYSLKTGERVTKKARVEDTVFLAYNSFR